MTHSNAIDLYCLPQRLIKRDGAEVKFDQKRIQRALVKAGEVTQEFSETEASLLTQQIIKVISHRFSDHNIADVEAVQDIVEQVLISANHIQTARAYIGYRQRHQQLRQDKKTLVDVSSSINEYLDRSDWRVRANANQGYSLGGLILNTSGKMIANYWLSIYSG